MSKQLESWFAVGRRVLATVFLLPLGFAAGCSHGGGDHGLKRSTDQPAVVVTVADLSRRRLERAVEVEGTLKAWEDLTLSAKRGGRVMRVAVDMGDRVKPGDVLVELDPVDADLAVREAEARYLGELSKLGVTRTEAEAYVQRYGAGESLLHNPDIERIIRELPASKQAQAARDKARQEMTRQQGLAARGVGTAQALQDAQNDFNSAQAALDNVQLTVRTNVAAALAARVALDMAMQDRADLTIAVPTPLSLPMGKTRAEDVTYAVTRRLVREGQRIKDGESVMELVVDDPIRLLANVPERFAPLVQEGQTARLAAMSRPGERFEGRVARINPSVDAMSRSFQVEVLIPNGEGKLRPGGFAKGQVVVDTESDAVVLPVEAVYRFAGVTKIYLVQDGRSRGYAVELGQELPDGVEVIGVDGPLPSEGKVVSTGHSVLAKLAEGTEVVVREPQLEPVGGPRPGAHEGEGGASEGSAGAAREARGPARKSTR